MKCHARPALITLLVVFGLSVMIPQSGLATDKTTRKETRRLLVLVNDHLAVGEAEPALAYLDTILTLDPKNPDAHYLLGKVRLSRTDTAEAESVLVEGMELAPLSSRLKLLLARVKLASGNPTGAKPLIDEVLAIKPHHAEANYLLGVITLATGDTTATFEYWEAALKQELKGGQK